MYFERYSLLFLLAVLAALAMASTAFMRSDGGLTPQEQRGREIYLRGSSPSGRSISAVMANGGAEIPGSSMACANCHGRDGLGKEESGVSPSNLTWDSLTRPYTVTTPSGRQHSAYDEALLKRAITMGFDPAGNQLQVAMPRYRMSLEDIADLIAYIKKLGKSVDPGLSPTTIQIGTVVPGDGPLSDMGTALSSVLKAYFEELNTQGGIFGRLVELHVLTGDSADLKRSIDAGNLFALVSPFTAGGDKAFAQLFEDEHIPVVGPVTLLPQAGATRRETFYLYSGPSEQLKALLSFAVTDLKPPAKRIAVICPDNQVGSGLTTLAEQECGKHELKLVAAQNYLEGRLDPVQAASQLREANADTLLFLGSSEEERRLAEELNAQHFWPNILLVGSLAGKEMFDLPPGFKNRVFLSYPTVPTDRSAQGMAGFLTLARKYKLSSQHLTVQISAYSSAEVLTEGLRIAGRELARERLIDALEGLSGFETGLMPKISYGPNKRIGARGAYVLAVDLEKKQLTPATRWIEAPD